MWRLEGEKRESAAIEIRDRKGERSGSGRKKKKKVT